MITYHLKGPGGLASLQPIVVDDPSPGSDDVVIQSRAWSLNYRDLAMPSGGYVRNDKIKHSPPLVPLSDVAGQVVAVGSGVTRFRVGDRVMASFFRDWVDGDLDHEQIGSALGGAIDGVLSEKVCLPQRAWVQTPANLTDVQAATLPCAAVTAWHAFELGPLRMGQTVLLLGTGGVSIFALQLAKIAGAKVIITSSSDEKLARAKSMGADETINYRDIPDWDKRVRELTDDVGVDHVIEVGGAGTLEKSLRSARVSGTISLIGILSGRVDQNPSMLPALFNRITVRGIYVGSRRMFEDLCRSIDVNGLVPVVDRTFAFEDARAAYEYLQSGKHFGKVVIEAPK
ncbi:zinc-dependent alcohol dehydrogenase family protein [Rubripirellula tenax]|nr:NAD(P)-dependent alcohol dehydrogenase [Rubripirellula tenax]